MTQNIDTLQRLRALRRAMGASLQEMSEKFDIPVRTLENWWTGHRAVKDYVIGMMEQIASVKGWIKNDVHNEKNHCSNNEYISIVANVAAESEHDNVREQRSSDHT